ncbi:hypothetical protein P5E41_08395 [Clostridium perfringens]|uniref:ABC-three component system protein n=1 Tax=Clostridium perfringens TaxID=1502 RepID=UPI000D71461C|nr:ABC-three component system protein [Clostridium perfringens]MDK0843310.1 hypothetical protein [Clostridium perfringens]MDM1007716.1 hypothetical protein [Clostridium perfringens]PWX32510.1 hypothetical protein CYK92_06220 [Clostridium perfringens]
MIFEELPKCKKVEIYNPYMGQNIPPLDRLKIMGEDDFEDLVLEWANGYIKNKYIKVSRMAGSGDKGRDIVAYYEDRKYDIYQCKHYEKTLSPSNYWVEFGKLCYYTYNKSYNIPRKYYIVASNGIGQSLRDYIDDPTSINKELINQWNKYCKNCITKKEAVLLDGEFLKYVRKFDFSIIDDLPPIKLIEQYAETAYYKFRFGGGIKKRVKPNIPEKISNEEQELNYIKELYRVYSYEVGQEILNINQLQSNSKLYSHLVRQREDFYMAQALKRFSRDEYLDTEPYNDVRKEIFKGIIDYCEDEHENYFKKVKGTLNLARSIVLESMELGVILPSEKVGICHDLVNDSEISWVESYE